MLLDTLSVSLFGNMFAGKGVMWCDACDGVIRAGNEVIWTRQGF